MTVEEVSHVSAVPAKTIVHHLAEGRIQNATFANGIWSVPAESVAVWVEENRLLLNSKCEYTSPNPAEWITACISKFNYQ
jgi:chemotaxis signal transduction protein